jgi:hypothetical protein
MRNNAKSPISSYAYVLSWDRTSFINWYKENKNSKIIFRFFYYDNGASKELTISGWSASPDSYIDYDPSINDPKDPSTPQLKIITTDKTDRLSLDNKSYYLGNLKLGAGLVQRIKTRLAKDTNLQFILFKPVLDDDNHVFYEIYLQADIPTFDKAITSTKLAKTDPSPPAPHQ